MKYHLIARDMNPLSTFFDFIPLCGVHAGGLMSVFRSDVNGQVM